MFYFVIEQVFDQCMHDCNLRAAILATTLYANGNILVVCGAMHSSCRHQASYTKRHTHNYTSNVELCGLGFSHKHESSNACSSGHEPAAVCRMPASLQKVATLILSASVCMQVVSYTLQLKPPRACNLRPLPDKREARQVAGGISISCTYVRT